MTELDPLPAHSQEGELGQRIMAAFDAQYPGASDQTVAAQPGPVATGRQGLSERHSPETRQGVDDLIVWLVSNGGYVSADMAASKGHQSTTALLRAELGIDERTWPRVASAAKVAMAVYFRRTEVGANEFSHIGIRKENVRAILDLSGANGHTENLADALFNLSDNVEASIRQDLTPTNEKPAKKRRSRDATDYEEGLLEDNDGSAATEKSDNPGSLQHVSFSFKAHGKRISKNVLREVFSKTPLEIQTMLLVGETSKPAFRASRRSIDNRSLLSTHEQQRDIIRRVIANQCRRRVKVEVTKEEVQEQLQASMAKGNVEIVDGYYSLTEQGMGGLVIVADRLHQAARAKKVDSLLELL